MRSDPVTQHIDQLGLESLKGWRLETTLTVLMMQSFLPISKPELLSYQPALLKSIF